MRGENVRKIFVVFFMIVITSPFLGQTYLDNSAVLFDSTFLYQVQATSQSSYNITSWFETIGTVGESAYCISSYGDTVFAAGRTDNPEGEDRDMFVVSLSASDGVLNWFMRIGTDGSDSSASARICSVAATPSIRGMDTSMITKSYEWRRHASTASMPSFAISTLQPNFSSNIRATSWLAGMSSAIRARLT